MEKNLNSKKSIAEVKTIKGINKQQAFKICTRCEKNIHCWNKNFECNCKYIKSNIENKKSEKRKRIKK